MVMRENILLLIKKYKKKENNLPFKKPILLSFLNIEKIAENFQEDNWDILWDEIMMTFEKINDLKKYKKTS